MTLSRCPTPATQLSPLQTAPTLRFTKNGAKNIAPATQIVFGHVMKHVGISQDATPATRKEATGCLTSPKGTTFCRTHYRHGHTALTRKVADGCERWTIADSCGRLRTVAAGLASTPSTPRPPEWNGNPCYAWDLQRLRRLMKAWAPSIRSASIIWWLISSASGAMGAKQLRIYPIHLGVKLEIKGILQYPKEVTHL